MQGCGLRRKVGVVPAVPGACVRLSAGRSSPVFVRVRSYFGVPLHWRWMRIGVVVAALKFVAFVSIPLVCGPAQAYSVLTHEAVIDSAWDQSIKPLLRKR